VALQAVENVGETLLGDAAQRRLGFEAAGVDGAVRLDRNFRTGLSVVQEVFTAAPARTKIGFVRRFGKTVQPGTPAWPEFADP
jgi:hypothetical protein